MRVNWAMMQHHKFSLFDLENMIAWERQVYVTMTTMYLKEENERIKLEKQTKRR
jgi:hypothetical protein